MERVGKYLIKEYIASGGMAEIYRGVLEGPHGFLKDVVIKAIHPHLLKDERYVNLFLREARLWARLNHSSIVQVYEFFEDNNRYYLVMEYVRGTDLLNVIKRAAIKGREIGIPRTIRIFEYVLSALEYAHNFRDDQEGIYGIVHRDISPQNILISINGDVKITDFGIAKASLSTGLTTQGAIIGKIDYMSPEQAFGKEVDKRTDIFSTGVVLWETLTGNKLFDGNNNIEILENVRRCEIIRPSSINPEIDERLERIVLKALSFDPDYRYQSASDFLSDLLLYLREFPHNIKDENITEFMRELFPEYVKDYTHRTEVLPPEEGKQDHSKRDIKYPIIAGVILFLITIGLAILLYPRSYSVPLTEGSDLQQGLEVTPGHLDELLYNDTASFEDVVDYDVNEEDINPGRNVLMNVYSQKVTDNVERTKKIEVKKGRLSLNAIPWADVFIGKKRIGTTPIFDYEIKAGVVEVIFRNDELKVIRKRRLLVEPERETRHTEDLTK